MKHESHPVVALAIDLINKASVTPHDNGCQALIKNRLERIGFTCETMRFGEVDNLWARIGREAPLFIFAGHTDVVPVGDENDWASPPFKATIRDGKLYGRGVVDMKGALAAMITAAENVVKNKFKGSIGFLITSDEEGPGIDGTEKVINELMKRGEKIHYCVIGEPSSKNQVGDQIRIGRRGSLHGKLSIHGKQGHVAHPHLADNAIHKSFRCLQALTEITWDNGNEHFPPTSFQITNINSGTGALNVIPSHLTAHFNFRFATSSTEKSLKEKTKDILDQHKLKYDIDWTLGGAPFLTNKGKLVEVAKKAVREVCDIEAECNCGGGTSDGRFIAKTGAEIIELGLLHQTAHHTDEHDSIENLIILTELYERIVKAILM